MNISAEDLLASIKERVARSESIINIYWHKIDTNREDFQKELGRLAGELPILPIVLREDLFNNPNAIFADLVNLITLHRNQFERRFVWASESRKLAVIILARTELSIHQAASPIQLPEWFPINSGESVPMLIEDITWTAEVPINSAEVCVDEICLLLYDIEKTLLKRLIHVYNNDHNAGNPLLELLRKIIKEEVNYHEFLSSALIFNEGIENPTAFRPSIRVKRSLISQLWAMMYVYGSDQLQRPSRAIEAALKIKEEDIFDFHTSLITVLFRPSQREDDKVIKYIRNLLVNIFSACQYVTAAAHADYYEKYPLCLIKAHSYDMRLSLSEAKKTLQALPH